MNTAPDSAARSLSLNLKSIAHAEGLSPAALQQLLNRTASHYRTPLEVEMARQNVLLSIALTPDGDAHRAIGQMMLLALRVQHSKLTEFRSGHR